jgi:hypothetical protein
MDLQHFGWKTKKIPRGKYKYTNSYLAAFRYGSKGQLPAIMFTHDPTFDPKGPRWEELADWCHQWGIDTSRIVFEKSSKSYCKEDASQVSHLARLYKDDFTGARVIHDAGNAFKKDGEFILGDGADKVSIMPTEPHGEISVLDNNGFGTAKNWWRAERKKWCGDDFSKQGLYLLWCIDYVKQDVIERMWTRNFLLDVPKLSLAALDERLSGKDNLTFANQVRMWQYVEAYKEFLAEKGQEVDGELLCALDSGLDGGYWK